MRDWFPELVARGPSPLAFAFDLAAVDPARPLAVAVWHEEGQPVGDAYVAYERAQSFEVEGAIVSWMPADARSDVGRVA